MKGKDIGFISQDNGGDVFFHFFAINMPGFKKLEEGDCVSFVVGEGDRRPETKDVRKL